MCTPKQIALQFVIVEYYNEGYSHRAVRNVHGCDHTIITWVQTPKRVREMREMNQTLAL